MAARRGKGGRAYQELLDACRELAAPGWAHPVRFVDALSIACLRAEEGDWDQAAAELCAAEALVHAGVRAQLRRMRLRALRAAWAAGPPLRDARAQRLVHGAPWRREA